MTDLKCPICSNISSKTDIFHGICNDYIYECEPCEYHFIDCESFSSDDILRQQSENSQNFGMNFKRNELYLEIISDLISNSNISNILEIGTPSNYDLLKKLHNRFGNTIQLNSYDIIKSDLPDYIKFHDGSSFSGNEDFDLLVCLHTLEHIPTDELLHFVKLSKSISKYMLFEVPGSITKANIIKSLSNPHYSYFTSKALSNLFSKEYNYNTITDGSIRFNNLPTIND